MNENKWVIYKSIWFWWVLTTVIYLFFNFLGYPASTPSTLSHVAGFVGLFVPFGFFSAVLLAFPPLGWLSPIIFILSMIFINKKLKQANLGLGSSILISFLALLVLTTVIDFARLIPFASWEIFLTGKMPDLGF